MNETGAKLNGAEPTGAELVRLLGGWLAGTDIGLLELRTETETIRLVRDVGAATPPPQPQPAQPRPPGAGPERATVPSPGVGVFLHRHPSRRDALVQPGQAVAAGDVVGLLRVGALLLHVTAPVDGTVDGDGIAPDGATVGYGAPLLRLQRSGT